MTNTTTILDTFSETETVTEEKEITVVKKYDVEVTTEFLVLQMTKKDARLLAAVGDDIASRTNAMQRAGRRLGRKLAEIGESPTRW